MNFDWRLEGFKFQPTRSAAVGSERLFRAWGGDPRRKWGNADRFSVCFSLDQATSRAHAELLYSVMEYQNSVWNLTEFSIPAGTPLWRGTVDPGDRRALLGRFSGSQVLIERANLSKVKEVRTTTLPSDLGSKILHTDPLPRTHS